MTALRLPPPLCHVRTIIRPVRVIGELVWLILCESGRSCAGYALRILTDPATAFEELLEYYRKAGLIEGDVPFSRLTLSVSLFFIPGV